MYFGFQVTVECSERGELLANLRKRYADLLDRIPRQVKRYRNAKKKKKKKESIINGQGLP